MDTTDQAIHEALHRICESRDLEGLMATTRRAARALTHADGVTFVLKSGDQCYYADEDAISPLWKGQRFPMSLCISGWVMQHAESVTIPDIYVDSRIPHDAYRPTFVQSMVMVPVQKTDPIAALGAYWKTRHVASQTHVVVLEMLAEAVAVSLTTNRWHKRD